MYTREVVMVTALIFTYTSNHLKKKTVDHCNIGIKKNYLDIVSIGMFKRVQG